MGGVKDDPGRPKINPFIEEYKKTGGEGLTELRQAGKISFNFMCLISIIIVLIIIYRINEQMSTLTIEQSINSYLEVISSSRSENTARTYRNGLNLFSQVLNVRNLPTKSTEINTLPEDAIAWFATTLKVYSAATERLYLTAVTGFYEFLAAENITSPNLSRIRLLIRQRARRPGARLPQFPRNVIEDVINYAINLADINADDKAERLRNLRDRAFIITLADTGLRVHEACNLHRGDIDWYEGRAAIIGKGNQQGIIRFSRRSLKVLKEYLAARAELDGASGKPLASLALFARHDKGTGKKIKPITTKTGRKIVEQRVTEAKGAEVVGTITPHSFRHYFVTTVLLSTGNLKLAQELARHRNISVTQRYAHLSNDELDRGYEEIFDE